MLNPTSAVHVFNTQLLAEAAVLSLQQSGLDLAKLSIVGRDQLSDEHVTFWVPGVGPLLKAGPMVATIIVAIEGATTLGGLSAVGAGLSSIGIERLSIPHYEAAIQAGQFVLIFHGTAEEVEKAREVLEAGGAAGKPLNASAKVASVAAAPAAAG